MIDSRMSSPIMHEGILHLEEDVVEVGDLGVQHLFAAEGQELVGQSVGPLGRVADLLKLIPRQAPFGVLGQQQVAVALDDRQLIVEIVGDPAGQPADGLHLLRLAELLLLLADLRDILSGGEVVFLPAELEVVGRDVDGEDAPVLAAVTRLKAEDPLLLELAPVVGPDLRGEVRVDVVHRHGEQLLAGISQRPTGGVIDVHEAPIGAHPECGVRRAVDGELRQPQRPLGPLAIRDVAEYGLNEGLPANVNGPGGYVDVPDLATLGSVFRLKGVPSLRDDLLDVFGDFLKRLDGLKVG